MPRQARIDLPGLPYHVIARGIERRKIFNNAGDQNLFLEKLSVLAEETETEIHTFALIPISRTATRQPYARARSISWSWSGILI